MRPYDVFGNLTQRNNLNWGFSEVRGRSFNLSFTYQNHRVVPPIYSWSYDADGRNTHSARPDEIVDSTYDAAGRLVEIWQHDPQVRTTRYFDGAGGELKSVAQDTAQPQGGEVRVKYYIRSSVLGEIISEANATGKKTKTNIYAAGATLARQLITYETNGNYTYQDLEFDQWDASGMSYRRTYSDINGIPNGVKEAGETDPTGTGMGLNGEAYIEANQPPERDFPLRQPRGFDEVAANQNGSGVVCYEDGFITSCARAHRNLEDGLTIPRALGHLQRRSGFAFEAVRLGIYRWHPPDREIEGRDGSGEDDDPISLGGTNGGNWRYVSVSWDSRQQPQPQQPQTPQEPSQISENCRTALNRAGLKTDRDINQAFNNVIRDILSNPLFNKDGNYLTGPIYPSALGNTQNQNDNAQPILNNFVVGNGFLAVK